MTVQDLTSIVGALGVPVVLLIGIGLFLGRSVWPWYTARQAAIDAQQTKRDDELSKSNERFILALEKIVSRIDANHSEVMREIYTLRQRPPTHPEPARDR